MTNLSLLSTLSFKQQIALSFSRSASSYDQVAQFQRQVADQLLSHLPAASMNQLLDLGTGTGYALTTLCQTYPSAKVLAVDIAEGMLTYAAQQNTEQGSITYLCADAEALPLAEHSVDLIYSSLSIQWCRDYPRLFKELHRILRPGGQVLIATLGPRSLYQLRDAWSVVDDEQHVNQFSDLESLLFSASDFQLTCQKTQMINLGYADLDQLLKSLKALGASVVEGRALNGLGGRQRLRLLREAYERFRQADGLLPLSYEVYFIHLSKE